MPILCWPMIRWPMMRWPMLQVTLLSVLLIGGWGGFSLSPAYAESAKLLVSEGPYYTSVPIELQVSVEGFEESPQPAIEVQPPKRGKLELRGVTPSVSSSIQIINGRMKQWKSVIFKYNYRFQVGETGRYRVGPFKVKQGDKEAITQAVTFKVGSIPVGGKQRVLLILPPGPLVVGQRAPIQLQWWIHEDLVEKLVQQEAQVPLFQMIKTFRFIEEEEQESRNAMVIQTSSGPVKFPASTKEARWKGDSYIVLTVSRTLIPLRAGDHKIAPSSVILEEGVRWRRSIFGSRTATHVRKLRVQDQERVLSVQPLPTQGKPASFAGAIGQGFTLEVAAQRTVLQAGDPVQLTLTLKGDPDAVATASLPPLAAGGGLSTRDFRVPEGETTGLVQEGSKQFDVTVRVLHEGVHEIPPIAYSWFDPEQKSYQTTHSRPIALSVGVAKMVSAADVIRHKSPEQEQQPGSEQSRDDASETASMLPSPSAEKAPTFTLMGADLAIEQDSDRLLNGHGSFLGSLLVQVFCYLLGVSVVVLAYWRRRLAEVDPKIAARQHHLKQQLERVEQAVSVLDIADALRQMASVASGFPRQELDTLLEKCDNLGYAPGGQQAVIDKGLQERAVALARQVMEEKS